MTPEDFKGKIICGTGHRPNKLGGYGDDVRQKLIQLAEYSLRRIEPALVISGMALGWDQALAQAAINLKIPFDAYIPCAAQDSKWPESSKIQYNALLAKAKGILYVTVDTYTPECMQLRNVAMVDASDLVIALWDGTNGGTHNCLKYAKSINKPMLNTWERWTKGEF